MSRRKEITMSRFTPGPWRYEPETQTRFDPMTGERRESAVHWIRAGDDYVGLLSQAGIGEEAREQNGWLIAASPEMLEALKAVATTDALQGMKISGQSIMVLVNAAIAKATGGEK